MTEQTKLMRLAMVRFEHAVLDQANLSRKDADESGWVADVLDLTGRLCCALRASLPKGDHDAEKTEG